MENNRQTGSFLSPEEKKIITEIASKDSTLTGKRAQTLLLVDNGETHTGAVNKTGLTLGQVRYALVRFKKFGLSMFAQLSIESGSKKSGPEPVKAPKKKKGSQEKSASKKIKKKKKSDKSPKKKDKKEKKKDKREKKKKKSQKGKKKK